jgi:hypothetical protein
MDSFRYTNLPPILLHNPCLIISPLLFPSGNYYWYLLNPSLYPLSSLEVNLIIHTNNLLSLNFPSFAMESSLNSFLNHRPPPNQLDLPILPPPLILFTSMMTHFLQLLNLQQMKTTITPPSTHFFIPSSHPLHRWISSSCQKPFPPSHPL